MLRRTAIGLVVMLPLIVSGCEGSRQAISDFSFREPPHKFYEGPDRSKKELAILDWARGCCPSVKVYKIDGNENPKFGSSGFLGTAQPGVLRVALLPGKHEIHWEVDFYWIPNRRSSGVIDMKAGHVYSVEAWDRYPPSGAMWIEDRTTGEVVLGSKVLK